MKAAHRNTILGGTVWLAMLAVPAHGEVGLGTIERMFLLAPLVLVPMALTLMERTDTSHTERALFGACQKVQPLVAALVAVSFLFPQGMTATLLALPWALLTVLVAVCGLMRVAYDRLSSAAHSCFNAAMLMLPVGGIGLVQSRFGATPLGFHEPWVLLVAVHFHYAAFIAPILVGTLGQSRRHSPTFTATATGIIIGSPLMAIGFVIHVPWLRAVAAFVLGLSLVVHSLLVFQTLATIHSGLAKLFLILSAGSIVLGMWFAVVFTLGDLLGRDWISIPQMARTHGILNGFGFSLCGLIGWSMAHCSEARRAVGGTTRRPQTLLSRWE